MTSMDCKDLVPICDLNFGKIDAKDYRNSDLREFFDRIFVNPENLFDFKQSNKYFIVGDKGTGKTAYAVWLKNHPETNFHANIAILTDAEYQGFVKASEGMDTSDYINLWRLALTAMVLQRIKQEMSFQYINASNRKHFSGVANLLDNYFTKTENIEFREALNLIKDASYALTTLENTLLTKGAIVNSVASKSPHTYVSTINQLLRYFSSALSEIRYNKEFILFVDGIDLRPKKIKYDAYIECVHSLCVAVYELNTAILQTKKIKLENKNSFACEARRA